MSANELKSAFRFCFGSRRSSEANCVKIGLGPPTVLGEITLKSTFDSLAHSDDILFIFAHYSVVIIQTIYLIIF